MFFSKKRLTLMLFCFSTALAMLEYLPQHIFSLTGSLAASYVYLGLSTVVDALLPPLLATVVLVRFCDVGTGRATLGCLAVSSSRVFFYLPYFYMYFYGMGADSIDALLLGAGVALIAVLAFFGYVMLLYLLARLMHRAQRARVGSKNVTRESLYTALKSGDVFDFAGFAAPIVFVIALASFIVNLPIVDTVSLIVNYGDSIRFGEVLSVILDVAIQLLLFVFTHFICFKFKDALMSAEE